MCSLGRRLTLPALSQIANGIAGYKEANPDMTDAEAVAALLPGTNSQISANGELTMQMDGKLLERAFDCARS